MRFGHYLYIVLSLHLPSGASGNKRSSSFEINPVGGHRIDAGHSSSSSQNHERHKRMTQHLKPPKDIDPIPDAPRIQMPRISTTEVRSKIEDGRRVVADLIANIEPSLYSKGIYLKPGSSAWFASVAAEASPRTKNTSAIALWAEEATKALQVKLRLSREQVIYGLPKIDIRSTKLGRSCPISVDMPCQPRKFRSYNGFCNNVQNPHWGSANTRYTRFLPADYSDGISVPRKSVNGGFLPSPREVTLNVHKDLNVQHEHVSAFVAYWGQFVANEISHTSQAAGFRSAKIKCCDIQFEDFHTECFPIRVSKDDPYYSKNGITCMEYVRSSIAPRTGCTLGPREQLNQVSSFLDASVIYGSSEERVNKLRTFRNGRLRSFDSVSGEEMLPTDPKVRNCRSLNKQQCLKAGDVRVNENSGLVLLHTLWLREHNRIALELKKVNRHWDDELIFQETRKIVGAELQHITYRSFLPVVLGQEVMDKYGLTPQPIGYYTGYDINMNPGVSNAVASAVLHFVLTMMPQSFKLYDTDLKEVGSMPFSKTNFEPHDMLKKGKMSQYLRGLLNQRAQQKDAFVSEELTNRMFLDTTKGYGLDMVSMLIQQGRDHGISAYIEWRKSCHLEPLINNWNDLTKVMPSDVVDSMKQVYRHIYDIDLLTAGLAEEPIVGALVGPTFACILGRQFHYLRRGDRYWYENDMPPSSFSKEKLDEIRKTSMLSFLCQNANSVDFIQPDALLMSDYYLNAFTDCKGSNIRSMDLTKWRTVAPTFKVSQSIIDNSVTRAKRMVEQFVDGEKLTFSNDVGRARSKSPEAIHYRFSQPKQLARQISNQSLFLEFTSSSLMDKISPVRKDSEVGTPKKSMLELVTRLRSIDVSKLVEVPQILSCDGQILPCDHTSKFRTYTGWCNNLNSPKNGKSMSAYSRMLSPQYQDGLRSPRSKSFNGQPLPSPRLVSTTVHYDVDSPHVRYSLMVMQFGQFLDHDVTMTPLSEGFEGSILDCKRCDSQRTVNKECYPITIPDNDVFYPSINVTTGDRRCISFTRSMPGQLTLGFREQLNQVTSYMDASNVYGSDECDAKMLRSFIRGRLNTSRSKFHGKKPMLPETSDNHECKSPSGLCFKAGDSRASEQPGLASIHTLFMRQHNQLVDFLFRENPHWNDEQLYQNTRRIMSAIFQHVTFNEFLPRVLGWDYIYKFDLDLSTQGYNDKYDKNCDANLMNEFGGAAFRFGHSLIKPALPRYDRSYSNRNSDIPLRNAFFNSNVLEEVDAIDDIVRGLVSSSMASLDNSLTNEVTNHLFEDKRVPFSGLDLGALNIQRGRDHGFPSYNDYRQYCNLTRARNFDGLSREVSLELIESLKSVYDHVDDIDLFTGGLVETPLHGGLVGPTFGCVIGNQFRTLQKCDRFWYENSDPLIRFTESQLNEIRKMTLSKILCDSSDSIQTIQRMSMDLPDPFLNPRISCKSLPSLDVKLWRERRSCKVGNLTVDVGNAERISPCVMCTCTKEGPLCQSILVKNCLRLATDFPVRSVLSDDICKVQCAHAFSVYPRIPSDGSNILGFSGS